MPRNALGCGHTRCQRRAALTRAAGVSPCRARADADARFATQKWVYHAVHMIYNGDFEGWDEEEVPGNKLVFIGKNLDAAGLRAGFAACLATPEYAPRAC